MFNHLVRSDFNSLWLSFLFLGMIGMVAFIAHSFRAHVKTVVLANVISKEYTLYQRDESNQTRKANIWLTVFYCLCLSIIVYKGVDIFATDFFNLKSFVLYLLCLTTVVGFYLVKKGTNLMLGFLFKKPKLTYSLLEHSSLKNRAFAIIAFPLVLWMNYDLEHQQLLALSLFFLIFIYLIIKWIGGIIIGFTQGEIPIVYSILYICTLEILPLAIAAKFFWEPIKSHLVA